MCSDDRGTDVSGRVIEEVADKLDTDPLELDPLYETIDPDALNQLFQTQEVANHVDCVEFTLAGCHVAVYGTGTIDVTAPEPPSYSESDHSRTPDSSLPDSEQADDD